ncbi:hypothetical protein DXG01_016665 [Tephrocybe rancida]|nr:hypothetical protein DXG01_016665 [Tephrocybe rancida]
MDLDVHTWAKTDISYTIFRHYTGLKDDVVNAFLHSQEAQFANPDYDVLHDLYLVTFIDDDQPSNTHPYASIVRGIGHIKLMLAAHTADKIVKHASKAAKRNKTNAVVIACVVPE